jgi:hypothetical protein
MLLRDDHDAALVAAHDNAAVERQRPDRSRSSQRESQSLQGAAGLLYSALQPDRFEIGRNPGSQGRMRTGNRQQATGNWQCSRNRIGLPENAARHDGRCDKMPHTNLAIAGCRSPVARRLF